MKILIKNNFPLKKQPRLILLPFALFLLMSSLNAQKRDNIDISALKNLPACLILKENNPYSYVVVTDYYNNDILGNYMNKMQVRGIYTRGLKDGKVRWNNVTISQASAKDEPFPEGIKQDYMENFTYNSSDDMLKSEAFKDFPATTGVFSKNLVWDVISFEVFAWRYYDSLKINIPFTADQINEKLDIAGLGSFENKDIKLTWTGISTMNNKPCAVIEFLAMDNPLNVKTDFVDMKGRSHYWGTIWLSLTDKQIEHGLLNEDVNMELKIYSEEKSQLLNTTRRIDFTKK